MSSNANFNPNCHTSMVKKGFYLSSDWLRILPFCICGRLPLCAIITCHHGVLSYCDVCRYGRVIFLIECHYGGCWENHNPGGGIVVSNLDKKETNNNLYMIFWYSNFSPLLKTGGGCNSVGNPSVGCRCLDAGCALGRKPTIMEYECDLESIVFICALNRILQYEETRIILSDHMMHPYSRPLP